MFAYENFSEIYDAIAYMLVPLYIIALVLAWKSINVRYLISVILVIETLDALTIDFAFSLGNYYYLWVTFVSILFLIPVLGRRLIAASLSSRIKVFKKIQSQYVFTRQEGGLIFLYALATLISFIAFIEASLYTAAIIQSPPIINNVYGPTLSLIHLLEAFLVLSLAAKGNWVFTVNKSKKAKKSRSYST
ncbi:hypothetical protein [Pseudoalteromonas luteoviolacea]|uniref:Uncharacterized protein n=1 Tax=Pseudoalteromonas luteoviolacea H33 TaxID=1365251 RepID=A0A161Y311_9GAMM|nr:hypothetical protein [Pseudoalteromonas luteoviolacea]KZN49273.1 hypothetical protein N476_19690 [Pseudoalteromonas luteoviolacea H33]KZN74924.1 hypothetical protein N477_21100 [Pseudoalteromonas luteoviolacea H33-S]